MADNSLLDNIKKYTSKTNSIIPPTNEEDSKLFNELINKDKIFNYQPLDIKELEKLAIDIQDSELKSCISFYTNVANTLGIKCIDTRENKNDNIENRENLVDSMETVEEKPIIMEMLDERADIIENNIEVHIIFEKDKVARGVYSIKDDKVIVLKQSDIRDLKSESPYVIKTREKYMHCIRDNKLLFDTELLSPSAAAVLVLGAGSNGKLTWRTNDNIVIDKYLKDSIVKGSKELETSIDATELYRNEIDNDENESISYNNKRQLTPEEMIGIGITELLNREKHVTVDLSDTTIKSITGIKNTHSGNDNAEEYEWDIAIKNSANNFSDTVFGYSLNECTDKLELKKALLLMGVPGVGKTRILNSLLQHVSNGDNTKYEIISFSQNTDYTDFIGGVTSINGSWVYSDGVLTKLCKKADKDRDNKYYLGIDELTRGNTEAIFGELMTGIEHRDTLITLKNGMKLVIPSNLYIIGTMNITDNSTKKLDIATLDRFTKYNIEPKWSSEYIDWICKKSSLSDSSIANLKEISSYMNMINDVIKDDRLLGENKLIGTRAISGIELNEKNIKIAVESQLIPQIKMRIASSEDSSMIIECLDAILRIIANE